MRHRLWIALFVTLFATAFAEEQGPSLTAQEEALELVHSPLDQLSPEFLEKLIRLFHVNVFIETSTYLGETSSQCAKLFKEVYTIEDNHKLFLKAKKKFKNVPNVYCLEGETEAVLKKQLPKIQGKILFWLVSHHKYQDQKNLAASAIRKELEAIKETGINDSIILINDMRLFPKEATVSQDGSQELSLRDLQQLLHAISPSYRLWILGDIAIAIPEETMHVSPLVKACTLSRLFSKEEQMEEVLKVEKVLMNQLSETECRVLDGLQEVYNAQKSAPAEDLAVQYILWKGLSLLGQKEYFEASRCFHSVIAKGFNHWRVYWYIAQSEYERRNLEEAQKALQKVLRDAPNFTEANLLAEKIKIKNL